MARPEIYVSTDVESDGPIPGPNSMLSVASAAFLADKSMIGTFSANLEVLPDAKGDPKTMAWWKTQPEAWAACRQELEPPKAAMRRYDAWLRALPGRPVFVAYPAGFDFMYVHWYLVHFTGDDPFSHSALDVKTMAMVLLACPFRDAVKRNMPARWFGQGRHTHIALDDALEQGELFCNMLAELQAHGPLIPAGPGAGGD